jgi:hypothetical protein
MTFFILDKYTHDEQKKIWIVTALLAGLMDISNVCIVTQYEDSKISASNNVTIVILHVRGKKRARQY